MKKNLCLFFMMVLLSAKVMAGEPHSTKTDISTLNNVASGLPAFATDTLESSVTFLSTDNHGNPRTAEPAYESPTGHWTRLLVNNDGEIDTLMVCLEASQLDELIGPRRVAVAFRTNCLVPLLNVGLAVPMGKHFSMAFDWYYPWIRPDKKNQYCFETLALDLEGRFWLKTAQGLKVTDLTGPSVGVSAFAGMFDYEWNYEGWQGWAWGGTIDSGYAFKVAKGKLRLEVCMGFGYARINYIPYKVLEEGGQLIRETDQYMVKSYWGLTKACLNLVIPVFTTKR